MELAFCLLTKNYLVSCLLLINNASFYKLQACKAQEAAVQRLYEALLAVRGGEAGGEELHAPRLRLRLLRSLHWLASRAAQRLRDRQPTLSYMAYRSSTAREVPLLSPYLTSYLWFDAQGL